MTKSIDKISQIGAIVGLDRAEIDYLIECWHDRDLKVRYHAYCKLNSIDREFQTLSTPERKLLSQGVLLEPGDIVWSVYQSGLTYDDSWYTIYDLSNETGEHIYGEPINIDIYDLWNREVAHKLISTHVDRESAEIAATQTIEKILLQAEYPYSGYYDLDLQVEAISQQDIYNLAKQYSISDLPLPQSSHPVKRNLWHDDYENEDPPWMERDRLRDYAIDILEKLTVEEHYELIDKIYSTLFGRLAYICKETVKEPTYFIP